MIVVEVPGVGTVEFPDGTTPEVMQQALQRYRAQPSANPEAAATSPLLASPAAATTPPAEEKGFGRTLWENIVGDDDPTTQNFGEKVGTFLNKAGESMTFGLIGDEADAAIAGAIPGGMNYDERLAYERGQEALFEETNPGAALTADIGGAVVGALAPIGAIGTLGRGANLALRGGASMAAGAGMGATSGFMEGEGGLENRLDEAKTGGIIGGVAGLAAPLVGAGVQRLVDSRAVKAAVDAVRRNAPSTEQLRAAARALYNQVDDSGLQIKPETFARFRGEADDAMIDLGLDALPGPGSLTPKAGRVAEIARGMDDAMAAEPTAALPWRSIDQLRRQAGNAAMDVNPAGRATTDARIGAEMVNRVDDLITGLGPDDVVTGDLRAVQELLPKAREMWARMSRSQIIDDAIEASDNYLGGTASGIRNQFRRILSNNNLSRGFTDAEKKVMRRVVNGTASEQVLNLLGGGLGRLAQMGGGAAAGAVAGPGGAALGTALGAATGALTRRASDALASRNAQAIRELIAGGGLQNLPIGSEGPRKFIEALIRRGTSAGLQ